MEIIVDKKWTPIIVVNSFSQFDDQEDKARMLSHKAILMATQSPPGRADKNSFQLQ